MELIIATICVIGFLFYARTLARKKQFKGSSTAHMDKILNNDPVLRQCDDEIARLNTRAGKRLKKDKLAMDLLNKYGIEIKP